MGKVSKSVYYALAAIAVVMCAAAWVNWLLLGDVLQAMYCMAHACFCILLSIWVYVDSKVE